MRIAIVKPADEVQAWHDQQLGQRRLTVEQRLRQNDRLTRLRMLARRLPSRDAPV